MTRGYGRLSAGPGAWDSGRSNDRLLEARGSGAGPRRGNCPPRRRSVPAVRELLPMAPSESSFGPGRIGEARQVGVPPFEHALLGLAGIETQSENLPELPQ